MHKTLRRAALAAAFMIGLSGCGALPAVVERARYDSERQAQLEADQRACKLGEPSVLNHAEAGTPADCFDFIVLPPPQRVRGPHATVTAKAPEPAWPQPASAHDAIQRLAVPALFALLSYHRHNDVPHRNGPQACEHRAEAHPVTHLDPRTDPAAGRWTLWPAGCVADGGLFFETYVYRPAADGQAPLAFIAFRGTENEGAQLLQDWSDNFASVFDIVPLQYRAAHDALPRVLQALKAEFKGRGLRIFTTGHSLGGGLAQLAAYMDPDIEAAYAFDPSPVTAWTWLRGGPRLQDWPAIQSDPVIVRTFHRHEFVSPLREVAGKFIVRRFGRTDLEFDFMLGADAIRTDGGQLGSRFGRATDRHSMALLMCNFMSRIPPGQQAAPGNFQLTGAMALQLLDSAYWQPQMEAGAGAHEVPCSQELLQQIASQRQAAPARLTATAE